MSFWTSRPEKTFYGIAWSYRSKWVVAIFPTECDEVWTAELTKSLELIWESAFWRLGVNWWLHRLTGKIIPTPAKINGAKVVFHSNYSVSINYVMLAKKVRVRINPIRIIKSFYSLFGWTWTSGTSSTGPPPLAYLTGKQNSIRSVVEFAGAITYWSVSEEFISLLPSLCANSIGGVRGYGDP